MSTNGRSGMTKAERQSLEKLVNKRASIAKADAAARGAFLLADAEAKLSAIFDADDERWSHVTDKVDAILVETKAGIGRICDGEGIPESFRPSFNFYWSSRGENALAARRAELRKLAQARVDALMKAAKVEIDREAERQLTQLVQCEGLTTAAKKYLGSMPAPEELLPALTALQMPDGQVLQLAPPADANRNAVTDEYNAVADDRNAAVTDNAPSYSRCPCGKPLSLGRGLYCSAACRQAAYRRRKAAPES